MAPSVAVSADQEQAARQIVENWKSGGVEYTVEELLESPAHLIGDVAQIVDKIQLNRERLGISYYVIFEEALEAFAQVVQRLAGT